MLVGASVMIPLLFMLRLYRQAPQWLADWTAWTQAEGLEMGGEFPVFEARGTLEGVEIDVGYERILNHKGEASYTFVATARAPRAPAGLRVRRRTAMERVAPFLGSVNPRAVGPGVGNLSISTEAPAGQLAVTGEAGALSEPEEASDGAAPSAPPSSALALLSTRAVDVLRPRATPVADFDTHFVTAPGGRELPIAVRRALLDLGRATFEDGVVTYRHYIYQGPEAARTIAHRLVEIARALEAMDDDEP
ncbi:MAG: hypothetical protein KC933_01165 [Myxococcales bacterium]|nr:hypothetical protein [Myxococcales bacterium]